MKILTVIFTALLFSVALLVARAFRISEIPNGNLYTCANCHFFAGGGGQRNLFGREIENNFLTDPGARGHVEWGFELAQLDSDGDGATNGEELQDPEGTWRPGDSSPGDAVRVTNPGDPFSFPTVSFTATLRASHQVPPVRSPARGMIMATLSDSILTVSGRFEALAGEFDAAQDRVSLHLGAAGQNGEALFDLISILDSDRHGGLIEPAKNSFALSSTDIEALQARRIYLNISSRVSAAGELRGQLLPSHDHMFRASLLGSQTLPGSNTLAHGRLVAELRGSLLTITGSFGSLSSELIDDASGGAHLHLGTAGEYGIPQTKLQPELHGDRRGGNFWPLDNTFTLDEAQLQALQNRQLYVELLSTEFPFGEVRGQFTPVAESFFVAHLSGSQQVPPVRTEAEGSVVLELVEDQLFVSGSFSLLSGRVQNNGAQLRLGLRGQTGDHAIALNPTIDSEGFSGSFEVQRNTFSLTKDQKMALLQREFHFIIRTGRYSDGEIRGQVLPEANLYFTSYLSGLHAIPPTKSTAQGAVVAELQGQEITLSGSFENLAGEIVAPKAHLHLGAPNENGTPEIELSFEPARDRHGGRFDASANRFVLSEDQLSALRGGLLYIIIPTVAFPKGEIRGQLLLSPNHFPRASVVTAPEEKALIHVDDSTQATVQISWTRAFEPDGDRVIYLWHLMEDSTNSELLISRGAGAETSLTLDLAELDSILITSGVAFDRSITLHHRVVSSDGSLARQGSFRKLQLVKNMTSVFEAEIKAIPAAFNLLPNHPNPFRIANNRNDPLSAATEIGFELAVPEHVTIEVYNLIGQLVTTLVDQQLTCGKHAVVWDGRDRLGEFVRAGIYFYSMSTPGFHANRRMLVLR